MSRPRSTPSSTPRAKTLPPADALPAWKWAIAYYGALVTRVSQVMAGEMTLDDAYATHRRGHRRQGRQQRNERSDQRS